MPHDEKPRDEAARSQDAARAEDAARPKSEPPAAAGPESEPPARAHATAELAAHGHGEHAHEAGHPAYGHVTPVALLAMVCCALMVLTIVTVAVTYVDLGLMNLVVALLIATVKASLVITYFMHLRWDARFNVLVFVGSFLFVLLFLSLAITDRSEYQPAIDEHRAAEQAAK
jgi:cytochrome c oxidase subunit 4